MAELVKLKQQRSRIKAQITRIQNFLHDNPQISAVDAQVKLSKLESMWNSFEEVQGNIDDLVPDAADAAVAFLAGQDDERQLFEEKYYILAAQMQTIIEDKKPEQRPQPKVRVEREQIIIQERQNKPKLSDIKLTEFGGKFTKWLFIKNSFETTIHNDAELTNMQKHQYLIGVLKGEARRVIEGFTISNENYENAWKFLKSTYDNEMMIIETYLDELLDFPSISKEDKADSIGQFVWHIQTHISSLKTLSQPVEHWDTLIIHLAKKKLDFAEQKDWQNSVKGRTPQNMPNLKEFMTFLTQRCHTLIMLNKNKAKTSNEKQPAKKVDKKPERKISLASTTVACRVCSGDHPTYRCEELGKLTPEDKRQLIMEKRLCVNCLNPGHQARDCNSSTCKKCGERHNTILHREKRQSGTDSEPVTSVASHCASATKSDVPTNVFYAMKSTSQVILSTAQVHINDSTGKSITCKALLDPGSQVNFMTVELARKLKLTFHDELKSIIGISRSKSEAKKSVQVTLKARNNKFTAGIECLLLPSITEQLPQMKLDIEHIIIPKEAELADPTFDEPGKIDVLIGAGLYWKILLGQPRNNIKGQPTLQNTQLGWIIGGKLTNKESTSTSTCLTVTNSQLSQQIERFWKQEAIPEIQYFTQEEKSCENYFVETVRRHEDGRFIVRLPTRSNVVLGNSKDQAQKRLEILERRFKRDPALHQAYQEFMDEYLET